MTVTTAQREAATAFELLIHRIETLKSAPGATVEHDVTERDPDTGEPRQIDVRIKRESKTTHVECRLHTAKQNVKWIEELMGRRTSLRVDEIVGVASGGFYGPAIQKAAAYGIPLFDLMTMTDSDVLAWGQATSLILEFITLSDLRFDIMYGKAQQYQISKGRIRNKIQGDGLRAVIEAGANACLNNPDSELVAGFSLRAGVDPGLLQIGPPDPKRVDMFATVSLTRKVVPHSSIQAVGAPSETEQERQVFVENMAMGTSEIIRAAGNATFSLNLAKFDVPSNSKFRASYHIFPEPTAITYNSVDLSSLGKNVVPDASAVKIVNFTFR